MKRLIFLFFFSFVLQAAFAQRVYFVYLQTEQDQAFFVKLKDKIYSSTASGYLILPKLYDTSYTFSVGFPQNKWPEQNFTVVVNKKDHGYLLKNFGEKGWGLFDLQTLAVQMAAVPEMKTNAAIKTEKKEVSQFTDILSKAVDDSTLREKQVLAKEEKRTDTTDKIVQNVAKKNETKPEDKPVTKSEETKIENKEQPVTKAEEEKQIVEEKYKRSVVTRRSESSTTEGFGLVFIDDDQKGNKDTIHILIPALKQEKNVVKQEPKEEKKFLDITSDSSKNENKQVTNIQPPDQVISRNNNCKQTAGESDFLKLRRNMAAKTDDDGMVDEAKKYFKTKCFTVVQIKNLSALFLNDAGKYKFFDAAYSYVADIENFSTLQSELKDEYYINRFKAMLRN